jgi:hypothetical protein
MTYLDVGGEASLVTHVDGVLAVLGLDHLLTQRGGHNIREEGEKARRWKRGPLIRVEYRSIDRVFLNAHADRFNLLPRQDPCKAVYIQILS